MSNNYNRWKNIVGVYCMRNLENNKRYVGSSSDLRVRKSSHFCFLRGLNHSNCYLQEDYNKHGKENFIFEVIEYCEKENLKEREQFWMDFYKSYEREFGYNKSPKSDNSCFAEETRDKIGINSKGRKHSEESKIRIGESKIGNKYWVGRKHSKESLKKIGESKIGNTYWVGRKHTEETKKKISEIKKLKYEDLKKHLSEEDIKRAKDSKQLWRLEYDRIRSAKKSCKYLEDLFEF